MLETVIAIAREAASAIREIYDTADFGVETKSDDSPLTRADLAAHAVITRRLGEMFPDIPVLSEEGGGVDWAQRKDWRRFFLVDPLDGTKEFISRNGEFTVNIALIEDNRAVLGVVYVPVTDTVYCGDLTGEPRAFVVREGRTTAIRTRALAPRLRDGEPMVVVASRRHGGESLERCLAEVRRHVASIELANMGSSLKFCLVAEGLADFYPRLAPTSEWDTAAAQAVVEAAGGRVVATNLAPLRYNTHDGVLNPFFYVFADPDYAWADVLGEVGT